MRPAYKNSIAFIFLLTFILLRVSNTHAIVHWAEDTEQTQCELCDVITQSQEITPILDDDASSKLQISAPIFVEKSESTTNYEEPLFVIVYPSFVYNKPPPVD